MRRQPIILAFALVLPACGGGGGNSALPATSPGGGVQAGATGSTPASLPRSFSIVDLGAKVQPAAINAKNDIAGTIAGSGAFIYRAGKFTTFAGGNAVAINDNDLAAGDDSAYEPNGTVVNLGTLNSATYSQVFGVDNSGIIAGLTFQAAVAGCGGGLTLFSTTAPLDNIGYTATSLAQSRGGKIVLEGYTKIGPGCTGTVSPFYYPSLSAVPLPSGLTLVLNGSAVTGINDANDAIGYTQKGSLTVTFFAHNGVGYEIDPAGAYTELEGLGINNADWIVGFETSASAQKAIVWLNGTTTDLNTLLPAGCAGWVLTSATAVNDAGYITGVGTFNGVSHGFLLVPQH